MFIIYPLGKCITLSLHHFADIGNDSSIRHFCTLIYIVAVFRNSQKMIVGYDKSFVLIQELNYWRSFSISLDSAPLLFIEKSFSHSCRRISAVYIHTFFHTHTHTFTHTHTHTHTHTYRNKQIEMFNWASSLVVFCAVHKKFKKIFVAYGIHISYTIRNRQHAFVKDRIRTNLFTTIR